MLNNILHSNLLSMLAGGGKQKAQPSIPSSTRTFKQYALGMLLVSFFFFNEAAAGPSVVKEEILLDIIFSHSTGLDRVQIFEVGSGTPIDDIDLSGETSFPICKCNLPSGYMLFIVTTRENEPTTFMVYNP